MAYIYKITSPSNKIYIGSTVDIKRRLYRYKKGDCKNQFKIYRSLLKYGYDNHKIEIVTECEEKDMYRLECEYGEKYDVLGEMGLNLSLPLKTDTYKCRSDEVKQKIRDTNIRIGRTPPSALGLKRKEFTKEHKEKLRQAKLGNKASEETKFKMSEKHKGHQRNLGRKVSDETKIKMSLSHLGKNNWSKNKVPWNKGIPCSEESKLKQIETKKNKKLCKQL